MFTGIVQTIGKIENIEPKGKGSLFSVITDLANQAELGASIATSGVCLTVTSKKDTIIQFEIMPETFRKTSLGDRRTGDKINLEPALKIGDELGGHFVYGHVDCIGTILEIKKEGDSTLLTIEPRGDMMKYIVETGSIAIDGVSLTVARAKNLNFSVSLVEYTLKHTTLGGLSVGDSVNVEVDMIAKYTSKLLKSEAKI